MEGTMLYYDHDPRRQLVSEHAQRLEQQMQRGRDPITAPSPSRPPSWAHRAHRREGGTAMSTKLAAPAALPLAGIALMSVAAALISGAAAGSAGNSAESASGRYVSALVVDERRPRTIYAGTLEGGVSKSTDGGRTWRAVNVGLDAARVDALAIDPQSQRIIYAATGLGVFKSVDGGHRWRATNTGLADILRTDPLSHRVVEGFVYVLAIDRQHPKTVYAGTGRGLFKSADGGRSWRPAGLPRRYFTSLAIDPTTPKTVYAGVASFQGRGGVFKTADGGRSWRPAAGGTAGLTQMYSGVTLAVDPSSPATVYAGSYKRGLFKSTDGARSWQAAGLQSSSVGALAIDPQKPGTVYAVSWRKGIFKSVDGGLSWRSLPGLRRVTALALDPRNPEILYAGTEAGVVFKSTSGGESWHR
jgi:photosystem II stability/assembly factor-like uncharacterized protein